MEIVRTDRYRRQAERLLSERELQVAEGEIAGQPERWPVIQGTGGCRKARARRGGAGKSGGARIVYFYRSHRGVIYFLSIFAKSEQSDLTSADKAALRAIVKAVQES